MFTLSRMRRKGEFHSGVVVGTRWAGLKVLISSDFHAQRSTEVMQNALGKKKKTSSMWQVCRWKCLVGERVQR